MQTNSPRFHDQFIVSRDRHRAAPASFEHRMHDGWSLYSSPTLPVTELVCAGAHIGWMLGWAILPDASFAHERVELELPSFDADTDADADVHGAALVDVDAAAAMHANDEVGQPAAQAAPGTPAITGTATATATAREDFLYGLPGRWACFITEPATRVYLDPAGSLALVYNVAEQTIASTTTLMNWDDPRTMSQQRFDDRTLVQNQFYPSGLTSDPRTNRLLPNHYLDTSDWQPVRHWPRGPIARVEAEEVAAPVAEIVQQTARFVCALTSQSRIYLPLTAGRDSRMVMAASKQSVSDIDFVTFAYGDWRRSDKTFARSLARRLGLSHTELAIEPATDDQKKTYLQAIGFDAFEGKARDFFVAAGRLRSDNGWVTSFGGEVGRADYWSVTDGDGDARDVLERLGLPRTDENIAATEEWMLDIPYVDNEQLYDFLSIEQRLGCWVGPQMYGAAPFAFNIIALNQRAVFAAMLSLPTEYVRAQQLAPDVVAAGWPALAALPFRRRTGVMGGVDRAFLAYIRSRRRVRIALLGRRDSDMDPASREWRKRQKLANVDSRVPEPEPERVAG